MNADIVIEFLFPNSHIYRLARSVMLIYLAANISTFDTVFKAPELHIARLVTSIHTAG